MKRKGRAKRGGSRAKEGPNRAEVGTRTGGPDARRQAMRLLAEGFAITDVAARIGVHRNTVMEWRGSPEGRAELTEARKVVAAEMESIVGEWRAGLRALGREALEVVRDKLGSDVPFEALAAVREVFDRGGMPRVNKVETAAGEPEDLSGLSDEELAQFEALQAKVRAGRKGGA